MGGCSRTDGGNEGDDGGDGRSEASSGEGEASGGGSESQKQFVSDVHYSKAITVACGVILRYN